MDSVALQCLSCKETPDRLAVCTVVRAVTHRLHLRGGGGQGRLGGVGQGGKQLLPPFWAP